MAEDLGWDWLAESGDAGRASDAAVRVVLEHLKADFAREAQARYHADEDGSDWQEAHRRVESILLEHGEVSDV